MLCTCGGTFQFKSGFKKGSGAPYAFYSCDRFPKCFNSFTEVAYKKLEAEGVTEITNAHDKKARQWAKSEHKAYPPKQRSNPNRAADIPYRRLTDEQEAVITLLRSPGKHMVRVNADAGVGKSTLAIQVAARIPPLKNEWTTGIIVSFGKKPADEMIPKLPFNWAAATVHSVGNDAVAAEYGVNKRTPNEYKTRDILRAEYGEPDAVDRKLLYSIVENLVELCKALVLTESTSEDSIIEQAVFYNIDTGDSPIEAAMMARQILKVGSIRAGIIKYGHDFGDMVYLPVRNNLRVAQYRYVIVDEAQDSSPARMQLTLRMTTGSFAIIGDKFQAIYGFTFADVQSMDTFGILMGEHTRDFPLTINWRCPSSAIDLARILVPSITARPNAPRGNIHEISELEFLTIVRAGDMVLCRVNADLVHAAYELIKAGVGAVVLGRDIGTNLKNIIKKLGHTADGYLPTTKFLARLNEWYNSESELISAKNQRNIEKAFQKLDDDYQCVLALCGVVVDNSNSVSAIGIASVEHVLAKIDMMFGEETDSGFDPKRVVTLSTVHKFKGGQCARIFILRAAENHPHPMAESPWELEQETCVLHVATTRCGDGTDNPEQALFFVDGMPALYRDKGGAGLITLYEGALR